MQDRIIQGALEMFFRFGITNTTMDLIAGNLGMSKKTLYQYFKDKNELVCKVTEQYLLMQEQELKEVSEKALDPIHETLLLSEYLKTSFQRLYPGLLIEVKKFYPQAFEVYQRHKKTCIHDNIIKNLHAGIAKGLFRKDIDVEVLAILRMEEVQLGMDPIIFPMEKFDQAHVQAQFLDHFIHGICTLKGHKLINKYKNQIEEE